MSDGREEREERERRRELEDKENRDDRLPGDTQTSGCRNVRIR